MSGYRGRGVHGSTVEVLGARIVDGTLAPGEVLDLNAIGAELDVSLTALREAIKVLTAKGLLDARQKRGTFVRPRAEWNVLDSDVIRWRQESGDAGAVLRDLAEVRSAIEPTAAALAAQRRDEDDIAALRAALAAMEAARDGLARDAADADLQFHQALLDATHNELFAQMSVFVEPALYVRDELVHDHTVSDPVPSHQRVVEAIVAGDVDEARAAALALLEQSVADVSRVLAEEQGER
ncbi:FadR family transcriptional regulator [Aeromicrobium camelliae]|uniref:FadR family transcriptional regulator n=1 Tax=Aeromicrobium camelliae TaxID=1538144 RepID=A0A3N6ZQU2_9ACTN|nr:FadR family transcriptional regulator [Aeromicrobium camelliae]